MNTNGEAEETCRQCGEVKCGDLIFHQLYCYDLYIPSAPEPRNTEQIYVDNIINKKIVEVLENEDYRCYHGYRNFVGGDIIIRAMQKPMKIIPVILLPVYKDRYFRALLDVLVTADKLRRTVLLLFDSRYTLPNLWQCCFSLEVNDPQLLHKIKKNIDCNRKLLPLGRRKQILLREIDAETALPLSCPAARDSPFRRSDRSRESFRPYWRHQYPSPSSISSLEPRVLPHRENEDILKEMSNMSFQELDDYFMRYWEASNEWIRQQICQMLVKKIKRNFLAFSRRENLENLELRVRNLIQCNNSASNQELRIQEEKLHCWILAATFVRVSTTNDGKLKALLRGMVCVKHSIPSEERNYECLCLSAYHKIKMSIFTAVKKQVPWPSFLETYLKDLRGFLKMLEETVTCANQRVVQFQFIQKQLQRVPWILRHIFILVLTEKVLEDKLLAASQPFFFFVCMRLGKKHWETLLEIMECITEHIQASHTQGAVKECLCLLQSLWEWWRRTATDKKLTVAMTILNRFFQKLLYHPLGEVRHCIAPLLFSKDGAYPHATELARKVIPADPGHVEAALRDHLKVTFPNLTLKGQMKTTASSIVVQGVTPEGNAKVYIAKQQTLNDILQTNATDSDCQRFQEVIKIVALCQDRESIAKLLMSSACGVPPLYVMEDGNPLLAFLQGKRNKLTQSVIIGILKDIATAVGLCHQKRVLLCNVTPASFIVVADGQQGTGALRVQVKLSDFFQARLAPAEEERCYSPTDGPYENIKSGQLRGESEEPLSAYFSAPESLQCHVFSAFSDAWAVAATFYSVLLYGGQTYFELSCLPVSRFIREICSGHRAQRPDSIPLKLWEVIAPNLDHDETKRMSMEALVEHLENYKKSLGSDLDRPHEIMSQFSPIHEEDIIKGYLDSKGNFKKSDPLNVFPEKCEDTIERKDGGLWELVSFRMNHMTKAALHALEHKNILLVKKVTHYFPMTTTLVGPWCYQSFPYHNAKTKDIQCSGVELIISHLWGHPTEEMNKLLTSEPLDGNAKSLIEVAASPSMDDVKLLTCLEQVASAMAYLHSRGIIHCDLQCSYVYVNSHHGCPELRVKVGRWGRAVSLPHPGTEDNLFDPYVCKVMPADAAKWAAPEVRNDGLYSRASDVFSFGIMIWEALTAPWTNLHMYKPLKPFQLLNSREVLKFTELGIIPGDFGFPNLARVICCMKACWNHNPTRRPAFSDILKMIREEIQANRESAVARRAVLPSPVDVSDYDSVYSGSEASEDYCSHIYDTVLESDPDLPQAAGKALDPGDAHQVEVLEGNDLYFSKQDKWGEMVSEFEAKTGIERSPTTLKETGWYGDTGIK